MLGAALVLLGGLLAYSIQTAGGQVSVRDVRFVGTNGTPLSALLYVPKGVTAKTPAPGILAVHGYINSREVQADFALEYARRGYVVLNLDQAGHGYSAAPAFANGYGGPAGLAYLRSLDIVDKNNIGLEGHSMGGWTILSAAAALPDGYKSMVLEGSSTGSGLAPEGSPTFPRNLALVYSKYDEFSQLMWEVPKAAQVTGSGKLKKVFGVSSATTIDPGKVYGDLQAGTARVLYTPATTHPGDHLSRVAIGDSIAWFQQTLSGGKPLPAGNQIWPWKEFGTTLGWIGFILLVVGSGGLLLRLPYFAPLSQRPARAPVVTARGWWLAAVITVFLPVLTYFPFFRLGARLTPNALWPQSITNQIMVWALLNSLISLVLYLLWRRQQPGSVASAEAPGADGGQGLAPTSSGPTSRWGEIGRSALLALGAVGVGYLALLLTMYLFKVDFRFWFVGLKPMSTGQFRMFLAYLIPFTLYALMTATVLHRQLRRTERGSVWQGALLLCGGFLLFLLLQYGTLLTTGQLFTPTEPLNVIVAIQFLPILAILGIFMTFFARYTHRVYAGAFVSALFLTWYIVAGQATQFPI
ncbi:alpha/beta fold hydrolase [Deinococcus sp. KSM4-11]|nr:alpha/beta fold hydrolase [Deinococcus sp. KSM4-11]